MSVITSGKTFANGEQLSADKLNLMLTGATFSNSAVDLTSTLVDSNGAIVVRDSGITTAKLATDAVTTAKIADSNVTTAKIADSAVAFAKLDDVIDDDTMATASATTLATSESIKAYVDTTAQSEAQTAAMQYSGATGTISVSNSYADLDLSSVVGSNRAMVIIEFRGTGSAASTFFRTKGSSVQPYAAVNSSGWGSAAITLNSGGEGGTIVIITDANGVIEHRAPSASSTANYTVQAYQVLQ